MKTKFMICYDISDDKKREHVRKILSEYGDRMQYSLFECRLSEGDLLEIKGRLSEAIDKRADSVRFYAICPACLEKIIVHGNSSQEKDEGFIIV